MIYLLAVYFLAGMGVGAVATVLLPIALNAFLKWKAANRKYTCDGCKTKVRRKNGYSPVPLDLDVGDSLVPLNLIFCRRCVPPIA